MSTPKWPLRIGRHTFMSMEEVEDYCFQDPEFEEEYAAYLYELEVKDCMDTYFEETKAEDAGIYGEEES